MKRGGQLIYSGSLGPLSSNMIKYFEVRLPKMDIYICKIHREEIMNYSVTGHTRRS
jgi:hypothetical protein